MIRLIGGLVPLLLFVPAGPGPEGGVIPVGSPAGWGGWHEHDVAWASTTDQYLSVFSIEGKTLQVSRIGATTGVATAATDLEPSPASEWAMSPSIAWNPSVNRFLVVWMAVLPPDYGGHIYGMILDDMGAPVGPATAFNIGAYDPMNIGEDQPRVACDGTNWLVAWKRDAFVKGEVSITGRFVQGSSTNAAPVFAATPFEIYQVATGPNDPSIGFVGSNYLVAWREVNNRDRAWRTVSTAGVLGSVIVVSKNPFLYTSPLAIAGNESSGEFLIAWTEIGWNPNPPDASPFIQRLNGATGALIGAPLELENSASRVVNFGAPSLGWSAAVDQVLVAWHEDIGPVDAVYQVRGSRLRGSDLSVLAQDIAIADPGATVVTEADLAQAARAAGSQVLVQWRRTVPTLEVQAQRYNLDAVTDAPTAPAPQQILSDGITVLPAGAMIGQASFIARAPVFDSAGDDVRLQVEVREVGTPFIGAPTGTSPAVASGATASVAVSSILLDRSYHWQARTLDEDGRASDWVAYGGNPGGQADLVTRTNAGPSIPASLDQRPASGGASLAAGSAVYDPAGIRFEAVVNDTDGDSVRLEVEVRLIGTALTGVVTHSGTMMAANGIVSVTVPLPEGAYHWQVKTVDALYAGTTWAVFGSNPESSPDVVLLPLGSSSGAVSSGCSGSAAGLPAAGFLFLAASMILRNGSRPPRS